MKGPLRRIRPGRRPADDPGQQQDPQATLVVPPVAAPADATAVQPPVEPPVPAEALPAGMAPADVAPTRPSFRDRGRLRRRLRYLRRVRELGFRDLGGLAFDLHRFRRRNDELVLGKLAALDAVDRELRAIERVLDDRRDIVELREPGIAACPRCGALHGSDANFCPQCGTQFSGPRAIGEVGGQPTTPPEVTPAQEALPISVSEQGSSPMSGALAGHPPAEAPAMADGLGGETPASDATAGGEAPTTATSGDAASDPAAPTPTPASGDAPTTDQPTQAFPALSDENGHGHGSAMTGGDPLASRERPAE
jgi:ribosomal protein L40E